MIQILLKNTTGIITRMLTSVDELAAVLNDPSVKIQRSLSTLLDYLMRNHYRTKINGQDYYLSNYSVGVNQPVVITFSELTLSMSINDLKLILKDQAENVLFEKEITLSEYATLLNDSQIAQCTDAAMLELYLLTHHFHTTIDGEAYWHKSYSVGINHLPTFIFVKI